MLGTDDIKWISMFRDSEVRDGFISPIKMRTFGLLQNINEPLNK
jgi:hypothetical protein